MKTQGERNRLFSCYKCIIRATYSVSLCFTFPMKKLRELGEIQYSSCLVGFSLTMLLFIFSFSGCQKSFFNIFSSIVVKIAVFRFLKRKNIEVDKNGTILNKCTKNLQSFISVPVTEYCRLKQQKMIQTAVRTKTNRNYSIN